MNWLGCGWVAATALLVAGCQAREDPAVVEPQQPDQFPVITRVDDKDIPYPTAGFRNAAFTLENDCLLFDGSVAFWPAGTTWDEQTSTVQFGGDFAGAKSVAVGSKFSGGGGAYSPDDAAGLLDPDEEQAVERCLRDTEADATVLVYPEWP